MDKFEEFLTHFLESSKITPAFDVFTGSILDFEKLLREEMSEEVILPYYRMIYAGIIGSLESYLSDTFIKLVLDYDDIQKLALSNTKIFGAKYTISDVSDSAFSVDKIIIENLSSVMWHNLEKVRNIYISMQRISSFPIFLLLYVKQLKLGMILFIEAEKIWTEKKDGC